jgi:hypothetical protein
VQVGHQEDAPVRSLARHRREASPPQGVRSAATLGGSQLRLYHERADRRTGAFGAGDEEECFTSLGRRQGVWLTSESIDGPTVVSVDVDVDEALPYDVTSDGDTHHVYVVPAAVVAGWDFV